MEGQTLNKDWLVGLGLCNAQISPVMLLSSAQRRLPNMLDNYCSDYFYNMYGNNFQQVDCFVRVYSH